MIEKARWRAVCRKDEMITEKEARKKWCPFAKWNSGRCIASECIHWVKVLDEHGYPGCSPFWAKMAAKYYSDNPGGKP